MSYFVAPAPPPSPLRPSAAVNINYVYGLDDRQAQTWMRPELWFASIVAFTVIGLYVPTHALLCRFCRPAR